MFKHVYTIRPEDVGKRFLKLEGRMTELSSFIGYVQKIDIGKRIYNSGGIYQVESNEQRDERESHAMD